MKDERLMTVLRSSYVSEKSSRLGDQNQIVFLVARDATKPEIKQAVEKMFEVEVEHVRVINTRGKANVTPPPRHNGLLLVPARARPVPFCCQGLAPPPLTAARFF